MMSGPNNIFNNLDEMMKCNLVDQIKNLNAAKNLNQEHNVTAEFEELDSFLDSPPECSSKKVAEKKKIEEKKSNELRKSRSSERSISPAMDLLENINTPVRRRSRRSTRNAKNIDKNQNEESIVNLECEEIPTPARGRRGALHGVRGKARGKGRGRGRGKAGSSNLSYISNDDLNQPTDTNDTSYNSGAVDITVETENRTPVTENVNASSAISIMERFLGLGCQTRRGRRRTGRNVVGEIAARCPTVDTIDLISSPYPRVEGSITLDSDGEVEEPLSLGTADEGEKNSLIISVEDENPEMSIKINWKGKPEAFKLRKYQKFTSLFQMLAEREGTCMENISLNLDDRFIEPDDSPGSIGYKIFHFIDGRVLSANMNSQLGAKAIGKKRRNANEIRLKIQSDKWKRPLLINILKTDKFRVLYIKCAEELNVGIEQIKLSFDGEHMELNDTPADLELEGGEAIDLRLKN